MSTDDIKKAAREYRKREDMAEGLPAAIALGFAFVGVLVMVAVRLLS